MIATQSSAHTVVRVLPSRSLEGAVILLKPASFCRPCAPRSSRRHLSVQLWESTLGVRDVESEGVASSSDAATRRGCLIRKIEPLAPAPCTSALVAKPTRSGAALAAQVLYLEARIAILRKRTSQHQSITLAHIATSQLRMIVSLLSCDVTSPWSDACEPYPLRLVESLSLRSERCDSTTERTVLAHRASAYLANPTDRIEFCTQSQLCYSAHWLMTLLANITGSCSASYHSQHLFAESTVH